MKSWSCLLERDTLTASYVLPYGILDSISHLMLLALITVHLITAVSVDYQDNNTFSNISAYFQAIIF